VIAIDIHQKPCEKAFMGANNLYAGYIAGKAVGLYFKRHFNCKYDTYVSLEQTAAGVVNTQRMGGYRLGFTSVCGKIHNLKKIDGADRIDPARTKFADALTALPGQSHIIVVSINDDGIEGALSAAKTAGRVNDLYVSGQGSDPSAWCLIKNNKQWIADSAYFPEKYGMIGIPYLIKLVKGQRVPKELYVPHVLITGANITRYYQPRNC
jgi:ribose transport system substrate-binding protein